MSLLKEPDLGTPARPGPATVSIEVDGLPVTVPEGTSVMRAAALCGIDVPKLCATDSLEAFGSCRLCLVEIDGRRGAPASCTTPVAEGMRVSTQTPKLEKLRQGAENRKNCQLNVLVHAPAGFTFAIAKVDY
ncbi:2Fe-2S iron-sulfur cluster-binding protein, partial [Actinoplanes philippinensis]|uniref:2Fe-2S iron-sulfur cluster-binding protein n=1 Tax=Actinoplanes philippinensis TaxID=35752 RepID=UPI0033D9D96B